MLFKKPSGISRIAVFLGNPGLQYEGTRHNAGFMAGDAAAKLYGCSINRSRFRALTGTAEIAGEKVLFMKPQTYMNLSGEAVRQAAEYYRIPPENIIVVSDEVSLPVGKIRIRAKGSAGGHNGLKNIISCLGSDAFARIRLGVGSPPHEDFDMKDWVLGTFKGKDAEDMAASAARAAEAIGFYIENGPEKAMNKYN